MYYRDGQQETLVDFRVVLRAYLSDRAEIWRSPSVANRWLFVMVARCLQQLRLVKRSPPSKTTDIFWGNLASVSDTVDCRKVWAGLERVLHPL